MEQVPPAAKVLGDIGQLFVWLKLPLTVIDAMDKGIFCPFLRVIVVGALELPRVTLPNEWFAGESVTGYTPLPLSDTDRVEGLPESCTVNVPDAAPKVVGANVTEIVQLLREASVDPQVVLATANGLPVLMPMLVMEIVAAVPLVIVAFLGVLVLFTATFPKGKLVGETDTWPNDGKLQARNTSTLESRAARREKRDVWAVRAIRPSCLEDCRKAWLCPSDRIGSNRRDCAFAGDQ